MSIFDETLTMNNGLKIPEMALGIWKIPDDQTPKAVEEGKLRTIGASSFEKEDLDNLMQNSSIKPVVNQILVYIGETPMNLIDYIQGNDIVVEAFSPIAHRAPLNDPKIKKIGDKYGRTSIMYSL
ncbi:aldo/keto reductase [Lactobacillus johnsonii]|uniref:aldo/keto reductase n=1 Tax=Lactobacillus johnsonii TaxID=33959 RepID=UPI000AF6AF46